MIIPEYGKIDVLSKSLLNIVFFSGVNQKLLDL